MHPPNILLLFPDQHRSDWLGLNSRLPLRTPNIDRLAARGTRFTQAFTPSPLCAPARACLASGRSYAACGVPSNLECYPLDLPTYYQRLRDAGYRVAGVGKFDLHKDLATPAAQRSWNLDGSRLLDEWGFTEGIDNEGKLDGTASYAATGTPRGPYLRYLEGLGLARDYVREHEVRDRCLNAYVTALPDEAYCDNWIAGNGLRFLAGFPPGQPWHLAVNFTGPHDPMEVTQRMHDAWKEVEFPLPEDGLPPGFTPGDYQRSTRHYAAMIENIDRHVGRFIAAVEARGELDRTLVVYSSDHGEMLGDHGKWGKGTWHTSSVGIPLVAAGPGVAPGAESDALVSLQDLCATFLDYAGAPTLPEMEARSLRPILEGRATQHRPVVVSALGSWRTVFDGRYKLLADGRAEPRLFDTASDPGERTDVAGLHPEIVRRLAGYG